MTLYGLPTCMKCKILKKELEDKGIEFEYVDDVRTMEFLNIMNVPLLEIEQGVRLTFEYAIKYIKRMEN